MWSDSLTAPKSGESGLLDLLHEARDLYQAEVMNQGKLYQRYADDFVNSHEFHDAIDAWSRNEHRKNYYILKSILYERRDLVESFFSKDAGDEELNELLHLFNTTTPSSKTFVAPGKRERHPDVSFHCCIDKEDFEVIAMACNKAGVFSEVVTVEDLYSLLNGKTHSPLHSRNNRLVAYFFNQLATSELICRNWQIVLATKKSIVSSSGKRTLLQSDLSEAVYANSDYVPSSQMRIIDAAIRSISKRKSSK